MYVGATCIVVGVCVVAGECVVGKCVGVTPVLLLWVRVCCKQTWGQIH